MEAAIKKQKEDLAKLKAACHTKAVWIEESQTCYEVPFYFGNLTSMIKVEFIPEEGKVFQNEVTNFTATIISANQVNLHLKFLDPKKVTRGDSILVSLGFSNFQKKISTDSQEANLIM